MELLLLLGFGWDPPKGSFPGGCRDPGMGCRATGQLQPCLGFPNLAAQHSCGHPDLVLGLVLSDQQGPPVATELTGL